MFWAARGELGTSAEQLIADRRGIHIRSADADRLLVELRVRIEPLTRMHRQNPLSTDLLASSTKRYFEKAEYRIRLDELLTSESHSRVTQLAAADLSTGEEWTDEEFWRRVAL